MVLLIVLNVSSSVNISATYNIKNTIYVGGTGSGNYTSIQNAIDNASNGDTVFVYNGTYHENVVVNKSITLIGENKESTIIDGKGTYHVVFIPSDEVNISGFTIQNSGNIYSGILITNHSKYSVVSNCIILNNWDGISLGCSSNNVISNNMILDNLNGISFDYFCNNNEISRNIISYNFCYGIQIPYSNNNNILHHNDMIENGQNVHDNGDNDWDDGWNGNYWEDYEEKYPYARKIWLKGIWSSPYEIPGRNNIDRYPLFNPCVKSTQAKNVNSIHLNFRLNTDFEQFTVLNRIIFNYIFVFWQ